MRDIVRACRLRRVWEAEVEWRQGRGRDRREAKATGEGRKTPLGRYDCVGTDFECAYERLVTLNEE